MTLKKQPRCSLLCDSSQAVPGWAVRPSHESHVVTGGPLFGSLLRRDRKALVSVLLASVAFTLFSSGFI